MERKKEISAIVFSDLHIADWGKFKTRTDTAFSILKKLAKLAHNKKVPLIHTGDLFNSNDKITNGLLGRTIKEFSKLNKLEGFKMVAITGNHSCDTITQIGHKPKSWDQYLSKVFPWLEVIDFKEYQSGNIIFHGVPYIDHNIGLNEYLKDKVLDKTKKNVLLLHTDYPGAKDTQGVELNTAENININLLSKFDLTLSGHIHKPQRLGKKIYMVGSPYQLHRGDRECQMGYWVLYDDLSLKFKPLIEYPKFIDVTSNDNVKEDGNYYTVVTPIKEVNTIATTKVNTGMTRMGIVKAYLKETNESDKEKKEYLMKVIKEVEND